MKRITAFTLFLFSLLIISNNISWSQGNSPCNLNASFTYNEDSIGCLTYDFQTSYSPTNNHYIWDFGDNTGDTTIGIYHQDMSTHTFAHAGTYQVTLYMSDGNCADTTTQTITVDSCGTHTCNLNAGFSAYQDTMGCLIVQFAPDLNPYTDVSHSWDFGDGTSMSASNPYSESPIHQYNHVGAYQVTLYTSKGNCHDTVTQTVIVDSCSTNTNPCNLNVSFNTGDSACYKYFVPSIENNNTYYSWYFGDGSTSNDMEPMHLYANPGTYNVTLYVSDSACTDTVTQTIIVDSCSTNTNPCNLNGDFNYFDDTLACLNVAFYSALTPTTNTYFWDFGDGTWQNITGTSTYIQHQYNHPGTYNVTLYTYHGNCADTITHSVTVDSCSTNTNPCNLNGNFSVIDSACHKYFIPSTLSNNVYYWWNFGDGTTSNDMTPIHLYANPGTYNVTLYVSDSACTDTITQTIVVSPCNANPCNLDSSFTMNNQGNKTYSFAPTPANPSLNYTWVFGDGSTSTSINPTHTYAQDGSYYVTLVVSNCTCSVTATVQINVSDSTNAVVTQQNQVSAPKVNIFPNPTTDELNIQFTIEQAGRYQIRVYNATGQMVIQKDYQLERGENVKTLHLQNRSKGMYIIRINSASGESIQPKRIVLK